MPNRFRLTLKVPSTGQDNFFLWSMVILPFVAQGAYIFDGYYFFQHFSIVHDYQGLLSTILMVFAYLRYCAPIESPRILACYYVVLCFLNLVGTAGYLLVYIVHHDTFNIVIYFGWAILEIITTIFLIYYRVIRRRHPSFHVESKHLFHFISRLEVILAIFIPFFIGNVSITLTKHAVAFFLLFDFFSDSYARFQGFWIKSILYFFVCTVTVCVASEWVFKYEHEHVEEIISSAFELASGCLCNTLIILQFIPYHLTSPDIAQIARQGYLMKQAVGGELQSIEIQSTESQLPKYLSQDTVIELVF